VATPFEELAMRFEAAYLDKVQEKTHKLFRELNISFENLLQEFWNDSFFAFKPGIRVDLKIKSECP
jgi:hypothetical protein